MHFSERGPKARGRHRLKCIIANLAALAQGLIKIFGFPKAILRHGILPQAPQGEVQEIAKEQF